MYPTLFLAQAASLLLDISLKSLILFCVAGLACLTLRRASAAIRHLAWMLVLIALLCLPVFCVLLPSWNAPLLPVVHQTVPLRSSFATGPRIATPSATAIPASSLEKNLPMASTATPSQSAGGSAILLERTQRALLAPSDGVAHSAVTLSGAEWVALLWAVGALMVLGHTLVGILAGRRLVAGCSIVTDGLVLDMAETARRALGINRLVILREASAAGLVAVPVTCGAIRPTVLLPAGASKCPADRLQVVLLHEMAHIRRWDWALLILSRAACACYWFHPLVWLAAYRLRVESERACDDLVLASGIAAPDYAAHLLEIVRGLKFHRAAFPVTVAMARQPDVADRLRTILAENRSRGIVTRRRLIVSTLTAAAIVIPLAALHPVGSSPLAPGPRLAQPWAPTAPPTNLGYMMSYSPLLAMTGKSRWEQRMPDGTRVRLLEGVITDPHNNVIASWTPGGKPIIPLKSSPVIGYGEDYVQFLCGIIFSSKQSNDNATISGGAQGVNDWTTGATPLQLGKTTCINISDQTAAPNQKRGTLQVTIADSPMETLINASPRTGGVRRLATGGVITISPAYSYLSKIGNRKAKMRLTTITVTLPARFVQNMTEYNFTPIGDNGLPFQMKHGFGGGDPVSVIKGTAQLRYTCRTSELPFSKVKEVRFAYHPSHTVIFRNVALRPIPMLASASSHIQNEREYIDNQRSLSKLRLIGLGLIYYAQVHHERFPDAAHWMDAIIPYLLLPAQARTPQQIQAFFHDPSAPPGQKWCYAYNRALSNLPLSKIAYPSITVAVFESTLNVRNASDSGQSIPHPGWFRGGNDYLFTDGHAEFKASQSPKQNFNPLGQLVKEEISVSGVVHNRQTHKPLSGKFVIFSRSPNTVTEGSVWPWSFTDKAGRFQGMIYPGDNYLMVMTQGHFRLFGKVLSYVAHGSTGTAVIHGMNSSSRSASPDYIVRLSVPSNYALSVRMQKNPAAAMRVLAFVPVARTVHR